MIGRDMGGTPTCRGEARGCRMRGDWLKGEEPWGGEVVNGTGMGEADGGTGDERSDPENTGIKTTEKTFQYTSVSIPLLSFLIGRGCRSHTCSTVTVIFEVVWAHIYQIANTNE